MPSPKHHRVMFLAIALAGPGLLACSGKIGDSGSAPGSGPGAGTPGGGTGPGTPGGGTGPGTGGTGPVPGTGPGPAAMACAPPVTASNFHRLNGKQYEETVNTILGLAIPLRADLPPDANLYGFDNDADTTITAALTQRYLDAAKKSVLAALADPTARAKLVPCNLMTGGPACVRTVLTAWLPKAFRRPVTPEEITTYANYATVCPSSAEAGLSCALQAALLSAKFLFRAEVLPSPLAMTCGEANPLISTTAGVLGQYALASRLSYFLWNGPPDDALYAAAASGKLADSAILTAQVDRMLAPASLAVHKVSFVADFPQQWLPLSALETVQPSKTLFPMFDAPLQLAMAEESRQYFADILLNNGSAIDLLRSNYTFVNDRLARHYGIAGVTGAQMRKVDTTGTVRGGVPTQASFLTATSSTENTSLVLRAKWVLNNLLCVTIPPPPDKSVIDAVPIPPPGLTNRASLEIRTANEPCRSCHVSINPIGFGLEIFDAVGAVRTLDKGQPIDASGDLIGAGHFANTNELLELLKKDERFGSCITTKMLTYALGRGLVASCDKAIVSDLAAAFKADDFRLRNHIVRIVQSNLFRGPRARTEVQP
jgi:hypothetical protein